MFVERTHHLSVSRNSCSDVLVPRLAKKSVEQAAPELAMATIVAALAILIGMVCWWGRGVCCVGVCATAWGVW